MTEPRPTVKLDMNPHARTRAVPVKADAGQPFRILVLGDFSGRENRGIHEPDDIAQRRLHAVDRDNFDELIERLVPALDVRLGANRTVRAHVEFREFDDFHPDALYRRVEIFDRLRDLRDRLRDPARCAAAIAELTDAQESTADEASEPDASPDAQARAELGASLLDAALEATPSADSGSDLVDRLVRDLVVPHIIPRPDPRQADLIDDVDRAISEQMRALLRAPEFQALEATWHGLYLLIRRLETDRTLQIHVLDVTRSELESSLVSSDPLRSPLATHVVERAIETPGGEPFAMLLGAYPFGPTEPDAALLGALAEVAARAGAPFVAAGEPGLFGCGGFDDSADPDDWNAPIADSAQAAWSEFRGRPNAAYAGLVAPRYLVRMPYGPKTSPTSCFSFEEESPTPRHDELLWGNSAFLVTLLLAESWRQSGWSMRPGERDEVDGLPVHTRKVDGETHAVPCAEIELTSRGAERIGAAGVMPLFSVRGTDSVKLGAVRSMSSNSKELAGRWD